MAMKENDVQGTMSGQTLKPTAVLAKRLDDVRQLALDACEWGHDLDAMKVLDIVGDDLDAFIEGTA